MKQKKKSNEVPNKERKTGEIPFSKVRLKERMKAQKPKPITQEDLAKVLKISVDTLKGYNRRSSINPSTLNKIADILGTSFNYLRGEDWQNPILVEAMLAKNPNLPRDKNNPDIVILPYMKWEKGALDYETDYKNSLNQRENLFISWLGTVPYDPDDYEENTTPAGENKQLVFPYAALSCKYEQLEEELLRYLHKMLPGSKATEEKETYVYPDGTVITVSDYYSILKKLVQLTTEQKQTIYALIDTLLSNNKGVHNG